MKYIKKFENYYILLTSKVNPVKVNFTQEVLMDHYQPKYWFLDFEILHYGTKEEMEIKLNAEQYNL